MYRQLHKRPAEVIDLDPDEDGDGEQQQQIEAVADGGGGGRERALPFAPRGTPAPVIVRGLAVSAEAGDLNLEWFAVARIIAEGTADESVPPEYWCARRLLRHPRWGAIRLIPGKGFVEDGDPCDDRGEDSMRYHGLTSQLERIFHPTPLKIGTGGGSSGGTRRGCAVDTQLEALINTGRRPEGPLQPYALKTMRELRAQRLQPFAAQVNVGSWPRRLATALDILCVDLAAPVERNIVNVQLKTGFDRNYDASNCGIRMRSPLLPECSAVTTLLDTYANRHLLQITAEHMLAQEHFGNALHDTVLLVISGDRHLVQRVPRGGQFVAGVSANLSIRRIYLTDLDLSIDAARRAAAARAVSAAAAAAATRGRRRGLAASINIPA